MTSTMPSPILIPDASSFSFEGETTTLGLAVIELSEEAMPLRRPDTPAVHIEIVRTDPQVRFEQILRSKRRHTLIKGFGLRVLDDLTPARRWNSKEEARLARVALAEELYHLGYTVYGFNGTWHTYVVELRDSVGLRVKTELPSVYVGETSKPIEVRYREHVEGARKGSVRLFSPCVRDHHLRLRPDLYEHLPIRLSNPSSKASERALADHLRAIGFTVKGGH